MAAFENQNLLISAVQSGCKNTDQVLTVLTKVCNALNLSEILVQCEALKMDLKATDNLFHAVRAAVGSDYDKVVNDIKKLASQTVVAESRELQAYIKNSTEAFAADANERFKKLETRLYYEVGPGDGTESEAGEGSGRLVARRAGGDGQLLKKMISNRMGDFEVQVSSQLSSMAQDFEKKLAFLRTQTASAGGASASDGTERHSRDFDSLKYDLGELKDMVNGAKVDTAHVKRVVLACERDMEDFTAAMDAVNGDLDEMRAKVDSTHSIVSSRQRVEATVTAEISTMRLDMGDMSEALKAHDAWMEDVSQGLQECHERCNQLGTDAAELREKTQAGLDAKTDLSAWNEMNDDLDKSIKTVRDLASSLRVEVDTRRRKVDETLGNIESELKVLHGKVDAETEALQNAMSDSTALSDLRFQERAAKAKELESILEQQGHQQGEIHSKVDSHASIVEARLNRVEIELRKQDEDLNREINERVDGVERYHADVAKETAKRLNTVDLRISGLQGVTGECKRDMNKIREEVNTLTVKSAANDVEIGRGIDDIQKLTRLRAEDNRQLKQDLDAVYEELDQKVYEKSFQGLEGSVAKLSRGTVKLCQVIGVFPGARANDGTEDEIDVDVELLNWEDCAQHLTARVEKSWRLASSNKYRSILDLLNKKADHSVLRLLQISQQHIEDQLDRVRHERELWREVVDKRAHQPMQLALTLKDPLTGAPLSPGTGPFSPHLPHLGGPFQQQEPTGQGRPAAGPAEIPKGASPLTKRIGRDRLA